MAKNCFATFAIAQSLTRLIILLALCGLSACVLPLPENRDVGRAVTVDPLTIKVGETTKDDVVGRLGEPDAIWVDERVFAYKWRHVSLVVLWFVVAPNACCVGGGADIATDELLLIQFDTGGVAQRVDRTHRPAGMDLGDFLKAWAKGGTSATG
jgi:hypothetical protein